MIDSGRGKIVCQAFMTPQQRGGRKCWQLPSNKQQTAFNQTTARHDAPKFLLNFNGNMVLELAPRQLREAAASENLRMQPGYRILKWLKFVVCEEPLVKLLT